MPPPLAQDELPDDDEDLSANALLPGDDELDSLPLDEDEEMPSLVIVSPEQHEQADDLMRVQQVAAETPAPAPPKPAPAADAPPELLRLQKSWQEVLNLIGSRSPAGVQDVKAAKPVALQDHSVILEFDNQFSFDRVQSKEKGRKMIEEIINRTLGVEPETYKIKCLMHGQPLPTRGAVGKVAQSLAPKPREAAPPAPARPGPFVDEVIAVFGGQLLDDDGKG